MRHGSSPGWAVAMTAGLVVTAAAHAQAPPAGKAAPAPATQPKAAAPAPAAAPVRPAAANEAVATVNGEPITRGEVLGILSRLEVPPDRQREAYDEAVDMLVNTHLLTQFLNERKIVV